MGKGLGGAMCRIVGAFLGTLAGVWNQGGDKCARKRCSVSLNSQTSVKVPTRYSDAAAR
jgi:hypothetical protein